MARNLALLALWSAGVWFGSAIYYEARRIGPAEQVIVDQFAATYCALRPATSKADADTQAAVAGLVSRMSVAAGVGVIARARYLECAIGGR